MSAIRLVGVLIAAIGYLSGGVLVAQPFASNITASSLALAFLFPTCVGIGLLLCAVGEQRFRELRLSGGLLLLIGVAALIGIFVDAVGVYKATQPTTLLWLVFPSSLFVGIMLTFFVDYLERYCRSGSAPQK